MKDLTLLAISLSCLLTTALATPAETALPSSETTKVPERNSLVQSLFTAIEKKDMNALVMLTETPLSTAQAKEAMQLAIKNGNAQAAWGLLKIVGPELITTAENSCQNDDDISGRETYEPNVIVYVNRKRDPSATEKLQRMSLDADNAAHAMKLAIWNDNPKVVYTLMEKTGDLVGLMEAVNEALILTIADASVLAQYKEAFEQIKKEWETFRTIFQPTPRRSYGPGSSVVPHPPQLL